jgi:zinc finger SWIM domain-containing protein 3
MGKGKLILICQSGGEFVASDNGTLSYNGGEANAVNVNNETLFDDLKLKLAEMYNFDFNSITIKYFLPGNKRHLITMKNAKDLKRMFDFHTNSVTVDIFLTGKEGFNRAVLDGVSNRGTGVKVAETVDHMNLPNPDSPQINSSNRKTDNAHVGTTIADDTSSGDPTRAITDSTHSSEYGADEDSDYAPRNTGSFPAPHSPSKVDLAATPADTVKKRRRTASWKFGANGPTIVSVADDVGNPRKPRRKRSSNQQPVVADADTDADADADADAEDVSNPGKPRRKSNKREKIDESSVVLADEGKIDMEQEKAYEQAYKELRLFPEKILAENPGSFVEIRETEEKRFKSLFVCLHASVHGFLNGCRPIIFLDSTSAKSRYREILLTATALDGNDGFFPLAFAIVDDDSTDSWQWFLEKLKSAIPSSQTLTLVSDKEKNIKETVSEVFENAHYGYLIYQLMESFKKNLQGPYNGDGKGALPSIFLSAAHSVRLTGFKHYTQQIKQISQQAYDWVMQIEPEYWSSYAFKGDRYNHITQNTCYYYENLMWKSRELTITQKLIALITVISDTMNNCRIYSSKFLSKLTPLKEMQLQEETLKSRGLKVLFSSDTLFEVRDDSAHVVNIEKWECSCLEWKMNGLPCKHAISVCSSTMRSVYDYCLKYFRVESYISTYRETINPIKETEKVVEKEETEATGLTEPTVLTESTGLTEPTLLTDATGLTEPTVLAGATRLTEPTVLAEATGLTEPTVLAEATIVGESSRLSESTESTMGVLLPPSISNRAPSPERKDGSEMEGGIYRRTVTCTRCKEAGHNKASCKATY